MKEIENRGLDLEAKMKELDLKAEKKSEFKSELDTLNEMLEKVGAELLTVKDGLRLIENGKHELKTASHYIAGLVGKCNAWWKSLRPLLRICKPQRLRMNGLKNPKVA